MHLASNRLLFALTVVALPMVAAAQAPRYVTSPKGYEKTEGNTAFYLTSGTAVNRRFMSIDNTLVGSGIVIKSFGLRNDGTYRANYGTISKMDLTLHMGTANFRLLDGNLDGNYLGKKTTVFKKASVSFPDWTKAPATKPAPFTFVQTLNSPFVYLGKSAFLWDMVLQGGSSGSRPTDRQFASRRFASGTPVGRGCVATGQTGSFFHSLRLENSNPAMKSSGMRFRLSGSQAPANGVVFGSAALADANIQIPGWCAKIHAVPIVPFENFGKADALGTMYDKYRQIPYVANAVGVSFYTQLFAADNNATGIVLSNASRAVMPSPYTTTSGHVEAAYCFRSFTGSTIPTQATWIVGGTYIAMLGQ